MARQGKFGLVVPARRKGGKGSATSTGTRTGNQTQTGTRTGNRTSTGTGSR